MFICHLLLPIRLAIRHVLLLMGMSITLSVRHLLLLLLLMRMMRVLPHGLVRMSWHAIGTGLLLLVHIHGRWVHLKWNRSAHHD